jgi:hypothetical protein
LRSNKNATNIARQKLVVVVKFFVVAVIVVANIVPKLVHDDQEDDDDDDNTSVGSARTPDSGLMRILGREHVCHGTQRHGQEHVSH